MIIPKKNMYDVLNLKQNILRNRKLSMATIKDLQHRRKCRYIHTSYKEDGAIQEKE